MKKLSDERRVAAISDRDAQRRTLLWHWETNRCSWVRAIIDERLNAIEAELDVLCGCGHAHETVGFPTGVSIDRAYRRERIHCRPLA